MKSQRSARIVNRFLNEHQFKAELSVTWNKRTLTTEERIAKTPRFEVQVEFHLTTKPDGLVTYQPQGCLFWLANST